MRTIPSIYLVIAGWALTASALPREAIPSLSNVDGRDESSNLLSGPEAMRRAYQKYTLVPSLSLDRRVTPPPPKSGTVPATPSADDTSYVSPVSVGSPAASYSAVIDTGSGQVSFYAPKLGSSGNVTTSVSMGGVTVSRQVVNLNRGDSGFGDSGNVVGMAPVSGSWFSNAVAQGAMSAVFTSNLIPNRTSYYGLGFIDSTAYTGSITYVTADTSQGFWGLTSGGYSIGTGPFVTGNIAGVIDTGTTLLFLPDNVVKAYYGQVNGATYNNQQGGYVFPCSAKLPDLTFGFSSYRATIPGSYLNYAPIDSTGKSCYGGLQSSSGIGINVFGLIFIKSQFIVFNGSSTPKIGFAKRTS